MNAWLELAKEIDCPKDWKSGSIPAELSEKLATLDAALRCPICHSLCDGVSYLPCGHFGCSLCFRQALAQRPVCPVCNTESLSSSAVPILAQVIELFSELRPHLLKALDSGVDVPTAESPKLSETVTCPICEKVLINDSGIINAHMDKCTAKKKKKRSVLMPQRKAPKASGRKKIPALAPTACSTKQVKSSLSKFGFQVKNLKRSDMIQIYSEFRNFWNAELHKGAKQKSVDALVKLTMEAWARRKGAVARPVVESKSLGRELVAQLHSRGQMAERLEVDDDIEVISTSSRTVREEAQPPPRPSKRKRKREEITPAALKQEPLPAKWRCVKVIKSGRVYYFNEETKRLQDYAPKPDRTKLPRAYLVRCNCKGKPNVTTASVAVNTEKITVKPAVAGAFESNCSWDVGDDLESILSPGSPPSDRE